MKTAIGRFGLVTGALLAAACLLAPTPPAAKAQSPSPTLYAYDSASTQGWPPTAPNTSTSPSAVVVEGIGTNDACPGFDGRYKVSTIESKTVYWVNNHKPTITEVTPETSCGGTLSHYESVISTIVNYVEAHASSNVGTYWGGMMLDEEPGYGFSASVLETLNAYVRNLMAGEPGISFYYTEDQPNGWGASVYNAIVVGSWTAPQVYSSLMLNAVNVSCATYGECSNEVTIDTQLSPTTWGKASWVLPQVNGYPWEVSYAAWGSGAGWWNEWRPV